jgi:hypothetical protein
MIDGYGGPGCSGTSLPLWLTTTVAFRDRGDQELLINDHGLIMATLTKSQSDHRQASGGRA